MIDQVYQFGIIGYGIAGQLLLLELLQHNIVSKTICICDETFLGGSLAVDYASVESNTPWWKTRKALEHYPKWNSEAIQEGDLLYQKDQCMPVHDIAKLCLMTANAASDDVTKITAHIIKIENISDEWVLYHTFGTLRCKILFLANGAKSKQLDLSKPSIPLSIALDKQQLKQHVNPEKDIILVFGTLHSGTILLHNLHELGVKTIGIYKSETPFEFARDGHYSGIKEGSEKIADSILQGKYTNTSLVSWNNPIEVHKSIVKSTKCIYSIGFKTEPIQGASVAYDPNTGKIDTLTNIYGFGIAYPGVTILNDKKYVDVSVLSFQEQIRKCLPSILDK